MQNIAEIKVNESVLRSQGEMLKLLLGRHVLGARY